MSELFYQLGRCFAFRQIEHGQLPWITWRLPLALTAVVAVAFIMLPAKPDLFGDGGLNGSILSLVATLPGFFIAALAAVSTFQRETLDETMPAPAPRLKLRTRGQDDAVDLTMRMFLSHLFAYLTAYSFLLALLCVVCEALAPAVRAMIQASNFDAALLNLLVRLGYVAMAAWFLSNIITAALFGMYFLAERMHRPNA
jgi:hypothetical protein